MLTVPQAAEKIIKRSRYLTEALAKNIINSSALARYIRPELEKMLVKKVKSGAIIMAIERLKKTLKPEGKYQNVLETKPEITIHPDLSLLVISPSNLEKLIVSENNKNGQNFLLFSRGFLTSTVVFSSLQRMEVEKYLKKEDIIFSLDNLSSITLRLPSESINTPGIIYFFLKSLAWENINIVEVISSFLELTLIFDSKNINKAFELIQSIF